MKQIRLDLHLHTAASPDSRTSLRAAAAAAKQRGITALAVCDHNRCAAQSLFDNPITDGVLFLPGVEYSTEYGHLLGLCLQTPCSADGEDSGRVRFADAAAAIHACGGLCVLAHPFELTQRSVAEIEQTLTTIAPQLDGIEAFNAHATKKRSNANLLAKQAAERLALLQTAGSDAHTPGEIGGAYLTLAVRECSVDAVREALLTQPPLAFFCGRCRHMSLAKSRFIYLRSTRARPAAYCKWMAFCGVCILRTVKGWFL